MNEFWLWFWKPIAELLGVLALLFLIAGAVFLWIAADHYWGAARRWWTRRRG